MMTLPLYFLVQEEMNKAYIPKDEVALYSIVKTSRGDLVVKSLSRIQKT